MLNGHSSALSSGVLLIGLRRRVLRPLRPLLTGILLPGITTLRPAERQRLHDGELLNVMLMTDEALVAEVMNDSALADDALTELRSRAIQGDDAYRHHVAGLRHQYARATR